MYENIEKTKNRQAVCEITVRDGIFSLFFPKSALKLL